VETEILPNRGTMAQDSPSMLLTDEIQTMA